MIKDWQIKNFKSLNDSKKINIKPITFLVGPNSSGKTSFLQSILMLRQTVESKDPKSALILQDHIDLGSFKDVVWKHDLKNTISINFSSSNSNYEFDFAFKKKNEKIYLKRYRTFGEHHGDLGDFNYDLEINERGNDRYYMKVLDHPVFKGNRYKVDFYKFYKPRLNFLQPIDFSFKDKDLAKNPKKFDKYLARNLEKFKLMAFLVERESDLQNVFKNIFHIGPLRQEPERVYTASGAFPSEVGKSGEWVVEKLVSIKNSQENVKKWFKDFEIASDFKVAELKKGSKRYELIIKEFYTGEWVNLVDVGFGASQILPIIVEGFISKDSLILIEQPEIHLHPKAQATMGDLLIDISSKQNNKIIIETHSDLVISRICTRIASGNFDSNNVAIYYLNPTKNGTEIIDVRINENGQYENFPDGFFEERYDEAMATADAVYQ
jgi:predicted ATPase